MHNLSFIPYLLSLIIECRLQGDSDEEEGDYGSQEEDDDDNEDETSVRIDPGPERNKGLHNGTPWSVG